MEFSYEQLVSEIENRRENVISEMEPKKEENKIDFLNYFFQYYSPEKLNSLADIHPCEFITLCLLEENRDMDFDILLKEIKEIANFLDNMGLKYLEPLIENLDRIDAKELDELIAIENSVSIIETIKYMKKVTDIFDNVGGIPIGLNPIDNISKYLKTARILKKIQNQEYLHFLLFTRFFKTELRTFTLLNPELQEKKLNSLLKKSINRTNVNAIYSPLYAYYREVENQEKKEERERNKKIYGYKALLDILKQDKDKEEIVNVDQYLDKIYEKDLEVLVLRYIYTHNQQYYNQLQEEYTSKSENSISRYISYFNEMSISFNEQDEQLQQQIMKDSLDIVKEKVTILQNLKLEEKELLYILANANLETIKKLEELLRNNYINRDFILNNLTIYYDEEKLKVVTINIESILKEKINLKLIEDKSFLLTDNNILLRNLKLLKSVGVNLKTLKAKSLEMLSDEFLVNKIASLIELGLEKLLICDPEVLNLDNNLIKRIVIARIIGMEIVKDNKLSEQLANKNEFFVADSMLDTYLLDRDNSNYKTNGVIIFDKEEQTDEKQYYDIEGIRIPKLRVNKLKISLESIIKPSFYTQEEVKKIEKYKKM